jgi:mRNA interferase MazF
MGLAGRMKRVEAKRRPRKLKQSIIPKRFEVYLVSLDPTIGSEIRKTRPCLIVSPDELNNHLNTVIAAPMTTTLRSYPSRVDVVFQGQPGQVALDQIRALDKQRLTRRLGAITRKEGETTVSTLLELFA